MKYKDHPNATIFPLMSESEINELAEDIKSNGLKEPITLLDNMILDGRNRFRACTLAGVEPQFQIFKGDNPLSYVFSMNVERRHLTASQKATVAVEAEPFFAEEAKKRMSIGGKIHGKGMEQIPSLKETLSRDQAAALVGGISGRYVSTAKTIKKTAPEMFEKVKSGETTLSQAKKTIDREHNETARKLAQEEITAKAREQFNSVCSIRCCSMKELLISGIKPDCIITDPPYPKKYLPLYEELAECSKSIPLIAVMCGQSYLPEIMATMTKHLQYRWTLAYLTPGGQAVQQWESKINAFWKPVLLFGKATDWIGDVCKSDANDKRFHEWGQSESGMADLIDRLSEPGQLICDPFVGGGTTAIVALKLGRRFVGCDIDKTVCEKAIRRCEVDFNLFHEKTE